MKKFLVMFLLLALAGFALADVYTIGTGTSTQNYVPFYGLYDYGWSKTIYTAAEINTAGLTTASSLVGIGFEVGNTPSNYTMLDQRVYLRTTTQSVYEAADNLLPDNTQFTSVFQGSLTYNGGGWQYVMFSTPFAWDGTSNIEVLWENWDGAYVSGYPNFRYTTTTPDYRSVYKYADDTFPATLTGTRFYNRPNIQFATPQTTPPNPAVAIYPTMNGYAFADASLSWQNGGGMPSAYDVYFGTDNPPMTLVSNDQASTSYTPAAALLPGTTYYWQIIPSNSNGPATDCPVWSFNTPGAEQLAESFNETTWPPAGWANPGAFTRSTTTPFHGLASAYKSAPVAPALLSTPMLSITASSSLNFWARTSATTGNGRIQIQYSPDRVTWTNIGTEIAIPTTTNWNNYSVDLSSLAGNNYYLAFAASSVTSTTAIYIDHVFGPNVTPLIPGAVTLTAPADAAINQSAMPTLTWAPGSTGGAATSYKVYLDTNASPTTLIATVPTASYTLTTMLTYNTTYYWKVIAGNTAGDAEASPVFSFTVMSNPTISTFPWTVNFGTVAADWPVLNWTQLTGLISGTPTTGAQWFQDDWLNVTTNENKAAKINIYGTTRYGWLVTPPIALPATGYTLKFDAAFMVWNGTTPPTTTQDDDRFLVVMSDSPLMTNPTIIREWNNTGSPYVLNSIPATGTNVSIPLGEIVGTKYFAFYGESTVTGNGDNDFMIDNVVIEFVTEIPAFTVTPESHNFGNVNLGQTAAQAFTVSNSGTGTLVINSVALSGSPMMSITSTLPTFPVSLTAGQTMAFTVTYAPTATGNHAATITIIDNLSARLTHTVALSGTGVELLNPPTNLTAVVTGSNVHLAWNAPGARTQVEALTTQNDASRALLGFKVYRNGNLVNTITNPATLSYDDNGLAAGTYNYTVTATYTSGESVAAGPVAAVIVPVLLPPTNLTATVVSNDVTLDWDNPVPPAAGDWMTWAQDITGNSVGTNAAAQFSVAHRWPAADLAPYAGRTITQMKFVPAFESCTYTVKVWTGGSPTNAGTLVSSQLVPTFTIGEWNLVILTTPVPVPATGELWYGFEVNTTGGYPAGCDDGPPIEGKGNMMYFQGTWQTLTALAPTLTYNWSIKAFAQSDAASKAVELKPIAQNRAIAPQTGTLAAHRFTPTQSTRAINGYKIYRDGVLISTITNPDNTVYLDLDLPNATYNYGVTATYTNGESVPATAQAVVNVQLAPAFFTDGFETYPDFALTFAPWTLIDVDQSGTYGITNISFPGSESAMAYIVFNPSATTPPITTLAPHGGAKMAASFAATAPPNNDWLITPRVQLGTGSAIKFYARSHVATYGLERFRVGVSTLATVIPQAFSYVTGPDFVEAPVAWTEYIYDLSAYDGQLVYIGIRCVSDDAFVFYVDDFAIHSNGGSVDNDDTTAPVIQNALIGNYPNPFNPETTIRFSTATSGPVSIDIYNLKGQLVKSLVNETKASGNHSVVWNGMDENNRPVSSGVYYYKMQAGKFSNTRKMILMK